MGAQKLQVFKCLHCGLLVEVLGDGAIPSCCGEPMRAMKENTVEASAEKHIPVLEVQGSGILVKVGSIPHPMEADHYIEWIEVINGSYVNRCHLKPGDAPQAAFYVPQQPGLEIRAYCNKHGLWKK